MSEAAARAADEWIVAVRGVLVVLVAWGALVVGPGVVRLPARPAGPGRARLTVRSHLDPSTVTASTTEQSLRTASAEFASAHASLAAR